MEGVQIANEIMTFLFPAVVFLLWFFFKKDMQSMQKNNENLLDLYKEQQDLNKQVSETLIELKMMVRYHENDISALKQDLKEAKNV